MFVADNKSQRMTGFVVLLAENNGANKAKLVSLAKTHDISIPLTLALEGAKTQAQIYQMAGKAAYQTSIVRGATIMGDAIQKSLSLQPGIT